MAARWSNADRERRVHHSRANLAAVAGSLFFLSAVAAACFWPPNCGRFSQQRRRLWQPPSLRPLPSRLPPPSPVSPPWQLRSGCMDINRGGWPLRSPKRVQMAATRAAAASLGGSDGGGDGRLDTWMADHRTAARKTAAWTAPAGMAAAWMAVAAHGGIFGYRIDGLHDLRRRGRQHFSDEAQRVLGHLTEAPHISHTYACTDMNSVFSASPIRQA